jgi:hypothetical protein
MSKLTINEACAFNEMHCHFAVQQCHRSQPLWYVTELIVYCQHDQVLIVY